MKKMFSQGLALAVVLGLTNCAYAAPVSYNLDEMVISASRMDLNLKELPQSAEIITKEEIKAIGATSIKEALRVSPSVVITEATNGDIFKVRGSSDVLILLNGRRLAREGGIDDYRLDKYNSQNIERIEILRGPAGALYGSDAQGAVINIITKGPAEEGAVVGVNTGKREMSNYYRFDTGAMGKLSASLAANFTKVRPFKWEDTSKTKSQGPKQNFNLDMEYEMDQDNKLNFFAEFDNEDMTYIMRGKTRQYSTERRGAALGYEGKSDKSKYSVNTSYSRMDRRHSNEVYKFIDVDARNTVNSNDKFTLTYGGEYSIDKGPVNGKKFTTDQWAGYVYGEYQASDKLLVIPSVRYDHHESFGSHVSPNLGLTYSLSDNSRIKASYGTAYRAPTTYELYKEDSNWMYDMIPNPDLEPESSKGIELAWERDFDAKTSGKLAYFKNDKEDAIVLTEVEDALYQHINLEEASYEGVELSLSRDLGNGFSAGFNYEYLDARDETNNSPISYTARNTYTAKLSWTEPEMQEWTVTVWNKWLSDYHCNDRDYSANTFNMAVNKSWEDNKYNAFVGVDNVFDKKVTKLRYSGIVWRVGAEVRF